MFWIDFFMYPFNIFMSGLFAGAVAWSVSGGSFYTFNLRRYTGIRIMVAVVILVVLFVWLIGYGLVVWYNTPLGPPLKLQ